jgi:hypothetical protein
MGVVWVPAAGKKFNSAPKRPYRLINEHRNLLSQGGKCDVGREDDHKARQVFYKVKGEPDMTLRHWVRVYRRFGCTQFLHFHSFLIHESLHMTQILQLEKSVKWNFSFLCTDLVRSSFCHSVS